LVGRGGGAGLEVDFGGGEAAVPNWVNGLGSRGLYWTDVEGRRGLGGGLFLFSDDVVLGRLLFGLFLLEGGLGW
jgi:hypothetical protein